MEAILIKALQLILSLSILVIVHEFGHFMFAKLFKVRVEKFYLFFNPWFTLFKYKPKNSDTEYGIGWLPLGGYVKISGMIDESMDKEAMAQPPKPWEFRTKPAWQRLLIMIGGVLMNFLLAFFIYSMMILAWGETTLPIRNIKMGYAFNEQTTEAGLRTGDIPIRIDGTDIYELNSATLFKIVDGKELTVLRDGQETTIFLPDNFRQIMLSKEEGQSNFEARYPFVVKSVMNGMPAAKASLEAGDSIVGINGNDSMAASDIRLALEAYKNQEITIAFYRNGERMTAMLTPTDGGKIGVGLASPYEIYETVQKEYSFFASFPAGVKMGVQQIKDYLTQFKYIFTKEGMQSLGGFGAIGNLFPEKWNWAAFWAMTAFLSIILGVMNLLPIPALDGGHVLFLLYEVISGRKPNDKFMEYAQMVGMFLLIALLLYANGMDIVRAFFK